LPAKIFPRIEATDFVSLGRNGFSNEPTSVFSFQPNLSIQKGAHGLRFGTEVVMTQYAQQSSGSAGGRITFSKRETQKDFSRGDALSGNAFASMLLGATGGGQVDYNVVPLYKWLYVAPWFQDDWRVNQKLTLNLGFRWDFNSPVHELHNKLNYVFDPSIVNPVSADIDQSKFPGYQVLGGLSFVGVGGAPQSPWKFDTDNIQLRAGATYQLNDKTIVRAGFGRFYLNPTAVGQSQGFSIQTSLLTSQDGNRTPLYNLANPFPSGVRQPPGSALGPKTFLGQNIDYSNPDFQVPLVDQFSIGMQRQLPWKVVLDVSYVGSRTRDEQTQFDAINEPPLSFRQKCDVTMGGSPSYCNDLLPNPFFNVPGFEGTSRFSSPTISRYDLNRPYPQFGRIRVFQQNEGKIWYDSVQVVLNKRMSNGFSLSSTYTYVPRWLEEANYVDNVARIVNRSPYFSDRPHRVTVSGIWELPFGKGKGALSRILGGWQLAGLWIYQSGRPWDLPTGSNAVQILKDPSVPVNLEGGQYIRGVQPCVAQLKDGVYQLLPYSVAAGCTEAYFLILEPNQTNTTMLRDSRLRRPSYKEFDLNLAKTTRLTNRLGLQIRVDVLNVLNTPMYDERQYVTDPTSAEFGSINKNTTRQSNFPRFIQLGFKLLF